MNKYTQDMTGTGDHIELPDPEPERYYDWMLWKLRQSPEWRKAVYGKPSFKDKLKKFLKTDIYIYAKTKKTKKYLRYQRRWY